MAKSLVYEIRNHYLQEKPKFLLSYFTSKIRAFFEVSHPRLAFMAYEFKYTLSNVLQTLFPSLKWLPRWAGSQLIRTRFGTFQVRKGTQDPAMISPAFKRRDWIEVINTISSYTKQGKPVLFLDIGANIGKFCISIGHIFRDAPVYCLAFEPVPSNFAILRRSAELNKLSSQKLILHPAAVHESPGKMMMSLDLYSFGNSKLSTLELEHLQEQLMVDVTSLNTIHWKHVFPELANKAPVLICKMDVEGSESAVLKGALEFFSEFNEIAILIEDTLEIECLYSTLQTSGFSFEKKLTPYNSWWKRRGVAMETSTKVEAQGF